MAVYNTVLLKGNIGEWYGETPAAEAITPGHLVERNSAGNMIKHATAGGPCERVLALEDDPQGKTIDDAYALNDVVRHKAFQRGERAYVLLATANNATLNSKLTSNGDGTFKVGATTDERVCVPLDALNNTSGAPKRLRVQFI
jgi:hypothetical protein